uniref:OTU family cysteine protease n=1 Tax=Macrostomum lignano TaxID=282301 RepID=A0A1I8FGR6_9PLAT
LRCSTNATNSSSNEVTTDFEVSYDHAASQAVEVGLRRCQDDVEVAENLPASEEAAAAAYALPSGQELPGNRLDSASGSSGSNSGDKEDEEKDDEATAPNQHQPPSCWLEPPLPVLAMVQPELEAPLFAPLRPAVI